MTAIERSAIEHGLAIQESRLSRTWRPSNHEYTDHSSSLLVRAALLLLFLLFLSFILLAPASSPCKSNQNTPGTDDSNKDLEYTNSLVPL